MYSGMLGVERLGRALGVGGGEDLVVEDVAPVLHLALDALAAHDDDPLERARGRPSPHRRAA